MRCKLTRKAPAKPAKTLKEYLEGNSPTRHNTIVKGHPFLKEAYWGERNPYYKEMILRKLHGDPKFLQSIISKETSPRARFWAKLILNRPQSFSQLGQLDDCEISDSVLEILKGTGVSSIDIMQEFFLEQFTVEERDAVLGREDCYE